MPTIVNENESLLLTLPEVARTLRCCNRTIYALIAAGKLNAVHQGRSIRFTRTAVQKYISLLEAEANAANS